MGVADTFHPTPVGGVLRRARRGRRRPVLRRRGPGRTGCTECGSCMTGCRVGAKNTLVKNYLYLAERAGAEVIPLTTVDAVRPRPTGRSRWTSHRTGRARAAPGGASPPTRWCWPPARWGTQRLLHRMRDAGVLPELSPRLGELTRTNSEAIIGVEPRRGRPASVDFTRGVAITSSFHPDDEHAHRAGPLRQGQQRDGPAADHRHGRRRAAPAVAADAAHDRAAAALAARRCSRHRWSERTVIAAGDAEPGQLAHHVHRRGLFGRRRFTSKQGHGEPNPTFIPAGHEANLRAAEHIGGVAGRDVGRDLQHPDDRALPRRRADRRPSPQDGVIDPYHRVFGYPGLSRRGRSGGDREPRREPVADHHGPGRAGVLVLAQQGRARSAPCPVAAVPSARARLLRPTPLCPRTAPAALRLPIVG